MGPHRRQGPLPQAQRSWPERRVLRRCWAFLSALGLVAVAALGGPGRRKLPACQASCFGSVNQDGVAPLGFSCCSPGCWDPSRSSIRPAADRSGSSRKPPVVLQRHRQRSRRSSRPRRRDHRSNRRPSGARPGISGPSSSPCCWCCLTGRGSASGKGHGRTGCGPFFRPAIELPRLIVIRPVSRASSRPSAAQRRKCPCRRGTGRCTGRQGATSGAGRLWYLFRRNWAITSGSWWRDGERRFRSRIPAGLGIGEQREARGSASANLHSPEPRQRMATKGKRPTGARRWTRGVIRWDEATGRAGRPGARRWGMGSKGQPSGELGKQNGGSEQRVVRGLTQPNRGRSSCRTSLSASVLPWAGKPAENPYVIKCCSSLGGKPGRKS